MIYIQDLLFHLDAKDSFSHRSHKITKNSLFTMGKSSPFYTIPLKNTILCPSIAFPLFSIDHNIVDVRKKKSKDRVILISPLIMRQIFTLPHSVALESYARAFQFKLLNSFLYTNSKLHKKALIQMIFVMT